MSRQLDILALEPYYGGVRKTMLETLIKCSRHRWTVLKLPPRRMERRLAAAAHWFGEQLSLHWVGHVDLLFASDALNLADLYRLVPALAGKPSVVYFHENHLPPAGAIASEAGADMAAAAAAVIANLSSAAAANELWFNSVYHQKSFVQRANNFLARHAQSFARGPLMDLPKKIRVMVPPTDLHLPEQSQQGGKESASTPRNPRSLCVCTRDADTQLLSDGLEELQTRESDPYELFIIGPASGLTEALEYDHIDDANESHIVEAMSRCAIAVSGRRDCTWDHRMMQALAAGCWPVAPSSGVYIELIPKILSERCLYESTPKGMAATIEDYWELLLPDGHAEAIQASLKRFNPIAAAKAMDERLSELALQVAMSQTGPIPPTAPPAPPRLEI